MTRIWLVSKYIFELNSSIVAARLFLRRAKRSKTDYLLHGSDIFVIGLLMVQSKQLALHTWTGIALSLVYGNMRGCHVTWSRNRSSWCMQIMGHILFSYFSCKDGRGVESRTNGCSKILQENCLKHYCLIYFYKRFLHGYQTILALFLGYLDKLQIFHNTNKTKYNTKIQTKWNTKETKCKNSKIQTWQNKKRQIQKEKIQM